MPATDDRWDVTVVGLRDPSHANAVMVVAELAHYASLPPHEVERMLEEGEVPVLSNLDRSEAERAAHELNELGAVVYLRLTDATHGVFPVLKPDADRQIGVAVGGLIDDSATPPTVGESFGGLPELEPDPEIPRAPRSRPTPPRDDGMSVALGSGVHRMPTGRHRPVVTRGQGPDPLQASPYVEPAPRHELLTDRGPPGLGEEPIPAPRPGERRPGEYGLHGDARGGRSPRSPGVSRDRAEGPRVGAEGRRAATARPTPRPAQRTPQPAQRTSQPTPRPTQRTPAPRKKKKSRPSMDGLLGDIGPSAPPETPKLPKRLERATAAAERSQDSIEIDFEAAGMDRPSSRFSGSGSGSGSGSPGSLDLDFDTIGAPPSSPRGAGPAPMRGAGPAPMRGAGSAPPMGGPRSAPLHAGPGTIGAPARGHSDRQGRGVVEALRNDGVAGIMLGLGVGLILSMVLALQLQRSDLRERLPPLEEELAASLRDPAGVDAGELRAVSSVEGEINEALDELERKFLLLWLGAGLPVGLLLTRLRSL